jgi:hypothetical protein
MNKITLLTAVLLSFASLLMAQINDGGTMPVSFEYPMFGNSLPIVVAPELDMDKVRREDQAHAEKGELYTIGRILPVKINPKTSGEWQTLRNGDRIWRVRIQSKGAEGLSLYFSQYNLPKGARMHVYSADRKHVIGGFTYINNHESGLMATSHVYSDDIIVEYYEPVFAQGQGRFVIEEVGHGYKDVRDFGDSGSCEVNVNCSEGTGKTNQRNAVARILVRVGASQGWCTGTLINNVRQDCTPYFITAWHCGEGGSVSDFNQWVFYFNYQGAACPDPAIQPALQTLTGAVRRADSNDGGGATGSDLLLLQLNANPPANYNAYYVGWDRNNTATTGGYGIHHPTGDIKKISIFTVTTSSTTWGSVPNTHWGVTWVATANGHGVTEGGSSGSALFNSAGRMIGTLTGGGSSCSNRNAGDSYGKFSYHWTGNGTIAARRLRDWLDPDNTGALTLDGIAAPCVVGVDAGVATIINPPAGQNICANPINPIVTLQNYGGNTITSAIIRYRINTGTVNSFNWSGSLATGTTTTVTLPSTTFPVGATFTFAAWTASPNGTTDANISNDTARAVSQYQTSIAPPYIEGFNAGFLPANIDILDPNADNFVWAYQAGVSAYGTGTGSMKYDNYNGTSGSNPGGTLDWFLLPTLDFTSQTAPQITFDVAYGEYGVGSSDTLIVAVSSACSPNYSIVYLQGGSVLATRAGFVTANFVPTAAEWANKSINLTAFAGQSHVSIAFINKSGWGNNIYVDNINILGACAVTTTISSQTNVACFGASTGAVTIAATNGATPYTYNRGTGTQTSATFTGLAAGTYNITVTDANSCTTVRTVTITQPTAVLASTTSSQTNITCFGATTGAFAVAATGGTSAYTFNRGTGVQTSGTFTNLAAGIYNVTVTDANSCTTTRSVTITQPASVLASTTSSQTNIGCFGNSTGAFTVAASGGTAAYTFNRGTGVQTSGTFTGLVAGTYNVTVTDANGCTTVRTVILTQPASGMTTNISSQTNIACFGNNTGTFTVGVTGGAGSYTYNRGTGTQTSGTFTGLVAGTYNVTVTDASACTTVQTVVITQPASVLASTISSQTNISCFGANTGAVTIVASGGISPYTYNRGTGVQTSGTFTSLVAGTYNVTVTDANSCTTVRTVTITQPTSALAATISSQTNIGCLGNSTGAFTVAASGGTAGYTFNRGTGTQTSGTFTGLAAGTYNVTVTDANSCTTVQVVTLTQPASGMTTNISSQTNIACFGANTGAFTVGVTGGAGSYTYNRGTGLQTSGTFTGLVAGTYNVTVTDASTCTSVQTVVITQPASVLASTISSQTNIACFGANTGAFTIVAAGGTAAYTFNRGIGAQTSGTFTNLAAGTYNVTVIDANSCTTVRTVTLTQPASGLAAAIGSQTNLTCLNSGNGSFTISATGGTGAYTYNRGTGVQTTSTFTGLAAGTYNVTVTDANGCTTVQAVTLTQPATGITTGVSSQTNVVCNGNNTGAMTIAATGGTAPYTYNRGTGIQTIGTFTGLAAGTYNITVNDAGGCTAVQTVTITQGTALVATHNPTNITCFGDLNGSFVVAASGGTAPYTFNRGTGVQTSGTFTGLGAGVYNVTVTDANGCTTVRSVTLSQPASALAATVSSQTNLACFGATTGAFSVVATGGTAPYTFNRGTGVQTIGNFTGLTAATYNVTVTDANNCITTVSITISQPAAALAATVSAQTNVLCFGTASGAFTITATGGTPNYTFNRGAGLQTSGTFSGLNAGTYTVTISDANGCVTTQTATLSAPTSAIAAAMNTTNTTCAGNDGTAIASPTGGVAPYTYRWSNNAITNSLSALGVGTLSVTITDNNGCAATASGFVGNGCTASCNVTVTGTSTNVNCFGNCNGTITATTLGATAPVSFAWSNANNGATISALCPNTYAVTATDAAGCTATNSFAITQPASAVTATAVNNSQATTTSASVTASGGVSPYAVLWSNGATATTISNLVAGSYTATVTDANGCSAVSNTVTIVVSALTEANNDTDFTVYPNPNTGAFNIQIRQSGAQDMQIRVVDVLGRELRSVNIVAQAEILLPIDLTEQASGVYFVVLQAGAQTITRKVVLTRD